MNRYIQALQRAALLEATHYIRQKERVERWYRLHPENLYAISGVAHGEVVRDPQQTIDITTRYGACWWELCGFGSVFDERSYHLRYTDEGMSARELRSEGKAAYAWLILADDVVPEPAGRALAQPAVHGRTIHRHELEAERLYRRVVVRSDAQYMAYS